MKTSLLFSILLFPVLCFSQKAYDIHCRIANSNTSTTAKGFLLIDDKGKGFIRLVTGVANTKNITLYDLDLKQEMRQLVFYAATTDSFIYNRAEVIRTLSGNSDKQFSHINIWLKKNKTTKRYDLYTGEAPFTILLAPNYDEEFTLPLQAILTPLSTSVKYSQSAVTDNTVTDATLNADKTFSRAYLLPYFTPAELSIAATFTTSDLLNRRQTNKPRLHYISINAEDTSCSYDAEQCEQMVNAIAYSVRIQVNRVMLSDKKFHISYVKKAIANLKCSPEDIIILTYSGHGFSYRDDDAFRFPQLALWQGDAPSREFLRNNSINLEEIYNLIRAKKAKMNIVIGDCCNTYVEMKRFHIIPTNPGVFPPRKWYLNTRAVSNLFLDNRNSYLIAATQKGEMAGSHYWYGGFFTYSLLEEIFGNTVFDQPNASSWQTIFPRIKERAYELSRQYRCEGNICGQHMIIKTN